MRTLTVILALLGLIGLLLAGGLVLVLGQLTPAAALALAVGVLSLAGLVALRARELTAFVQGRQFRYGANTTFTVLLVAVIFVLAYLFLARYHKRWDFSEGGLYTLAPQTERVLGALQEPVHVVAIDRQSMQGQANPGWRMTEQTLELYDYAGGDMFSFEMLDDQLNRTKVQPYLEYLSGYEKPPVLLVTRTTEDGPREVEKITSREEEQLTNAIIRLTHKSSSRVYVTTGHGEVALTSDNPRNRLALLRNDLELQGHTIEALPTLEHEQFPDDADIVMIVGPQNEFYPHELGALEQFLARGGDLLVCLDPQNCPKLSRWLADRVGLAPGHDIVVERDQLSQMLGGDPTTIIIQDFNPAHPITESLARQQLRMLIPVTRSVALADERPAGMRGDWLMRTRKKTSWGETDWTAFRQGVARKDAADNSGPVSVGAAAVLPATAVAADVTDALQLAGYDRESRVVVFGSSAVLTDDGLENYGTAALVNNAFNWLAGRSELISIPPKELRNTALVLSRGAMIALMLVCVIAIPLAFFVVGSVVFFLRRSAS